ncbi:MAG: DUF357 domain-containing protein [Candidatus Hecatellaceae archaeon]
MKETELEGRYQKYSEGLAQAFSTLKLTVEGEALASKVSEIVELAKCYRQDAEHFYRQNMKVTALISLAYGEGLLDALRMLGYVDFKWVGSLER